MLKAPGITKLCDAAGCRNVLQSPELIYCRDCWQRVPDQIRRRVNCAAAREALEAAA